MDIQIRGAKENNLKNIDVNIRDGLTVVTGVSGSGKTSLVFDTLYHEAQRRFLDVYLYGRGGQRLLPAKVDSISGLGPTIAVGQNLLNRNPNSILATASGLHPFFRLLFTNFGKRLCLYCGKPISVLTEDEIIKNIITISKKYSLQIIAPLINNLKGSHRTLLSVLRSKIGPENLIINGSNWNLSPLDPSISHTIEINTGLINDETSVISIRNIVRESLILGAGSIKLYSNNDFLVLTTQFTCVSCGVGLGKLRATYFNQQCPFCKGLGCERCGQTGMNPKAASVRWENMCFPDLLSISVDECLDLFNTVTLPSTAQRLKIEILRRLEALNRVGLGYLSLDRSSPSLSRGESQRVRLAISLSNRLEDVLHVLDEPTIGQHPTDVARFLPAFKDLPGPVVYVEHDRLAAAAADRVIDLGPGAGVDGGKVVFEGTPSDLWLSDSSSGNYFSLRKRVESNVSAPKTDRILIIKGARKHNLQSINVEIPLGRLTVVSGVSGSGKSTLIEHVLVPSLKQQKPINCSEFTPVQIKPILVDQTPIGRNPRSNPATYTKLSDYIRDIFAEATGLSKSHFSFNRPEGYCQDCNGLGAEEIKMRYLPSIWVPCSTCEGKRFNLDVLSKTVNFSSRKLTIAEIYDSPIGDLWRIISKSDYLTPKRFQSVKRIIMALIDVGLGYLKLGQPSPTLSGGEAQRVKLSKFLGKGNLHKQLLVLDEPSTGLHPQDLVGLLSILYRLVDQGATIIVIEHNLDIVRSADWVVDLGPGAGPWGGQILYQGPPKGLLTLETSETGKSLKEENSLIPSGISNLWTKKPVRAISIRNAKANNLKNVSVDIPKDKFTVVTGVSGSGKSSLIRDVLETEARRRYIETLSMYERQGLREGAEALVDSVSGVGVTMTLDSHHAHLWSRLPQFTRRNTVGGITELSFHLANILASLGKRRCLECGMEMVRGEEWYCSDCGIFAKIALPQHFSTGHWISSCKKCDGLGSLLLPAPEKLIVQPDKPLCAGAMYSPGYWPKTYLCVDQPIIAEIGKHYGFDPMKTSWNDMTDEAKQAFLYGDGENYTWSYISKGGRSKGQEKSSTWTWRGFYGNDSWIFDGDIHGTYTRKVTCPLCEGSGLRSAYLAVNLHGRNIFDLNELPLIDLEKFVNHLQLETDVRSNVETSYKILNKRLRFLIQVGIGYLNLNRPTGTLSAGEAQRIQLSSLLGSELTSLTILVDEPSRGLHPSELESLCEAILELKEQGNTVIVVEHDPQLIRAADYIIDMGPGAGINGGTIVASGTPEDIINERTTTGEWLNKSRLEFNKDTRRRRANDWMIIRGARGNNLKGSDVAFPLGTLIGVCGVSGSGKSTLLLDTIGRALAQKSHSSSFSQEPIEPLEYKDLENPPQRTYLIDQVRRGIRNPATYLGLDSHLHKIYADSDDAKALGLRLEDLKMKCSACKGQGFIRIPMDFLPDEWIECEICNKSGYTPEAWDVQVNGIPLPEIINLTFDEIHNEFTTEENFVRRLDVIRQVGLGYLVWQQSTRTLSGGEIQRLKIAKELQKATRGKTLYIVDEPTIGMHLKDVQVLLGLFHKLIDDGHTVIAIEHHIHLLAACDWIIELGPTGGPGGGEIIGAGTPEKVSTLNTPTALFLKKIIRTPL
jgi:excinuclease ABC subunit A